jgi:DNA repair protein SbcD/Mre11
MFAAMRFLHTADWHLGRLFHNVHLTDDQAVVLDQLVDLVREAKPDAVLVAGDLYDRAVPPPEAVELLDDVLTRIVVGLGVPVVAIAGNHDSPSRVGFGRALLRERGLHLAGLLASSPPVFTLQDVHGPIHLVSLPYAEPAMARHAYAEQGIHDQQAVVAAGVERALAAVPPGERRVLLAHAFVAGGAESESERPLSVGGAGSVTAGTFEGFDYVALGHLHGPQRVGAESVRYAGSLLKYSFSEAEHRKSVSMVEIGAPGSADGDAGAAGRAGVAVETVPLTPLRDVRVVDGLLADLLSRGRDDPRGDDYIHAVLRDTSALLDPLGRLREVYPNVLGIERPELERDARPGRAASDLLRRSETDLFADFFVSVTGDPLSEAQAAAFAATVDELLGRQRESAT